MAKSNIGQTGAESIRIGNRTLDELPIAEAAHAKEGIAEFLKTEHDNKILAVRAKYPDTPMVSIDAFLRECKDNLARTRQFIADIEGRKNNYASLIGVCKHRDKMLEKLDPEDDAAQIRELKKNFPPYDVPAMKQQVKQFEESIEQGHRVCAKEMESINELNKLRIECEMRDKELAALGVN